MALSCWFHVLMCDINKSAAYSFAHRTLQINWNVFCSQLNGMEWNGGEYHTLVSTSQTEIHFFYPFNCNDNTIGISIMMLYACVRACMYECVFMIRSHDILNPLNHVVNVFCFSLPFSLYFMFAFAFGYTCYIAWMGVEYIYHKDLVSISPKQQQQ